MGIRSKTLLIIGCLITASLVGFIIIAQLVLVRGFVKVETEATYKDVARVVDGIKSNLHTINAKGTDWTYWDDTFQFVQDRNKAYIEDNLNTSIAGQAITYWMFYNSKHQLIHTAAYDLETLEPIEAPNSLKKVLTPTSPFLTSTDIKGTEVILNLSDGPMLMVSRPALRSDKSGPASGTVILATPLDAAKIKEISDTTHLPITLYSADKADLPADVKHYRDTLSKDMSTVKDGMVVHPLSAQKIAGYTTITDGLGGPGLIVRIEEPRSVYQQGQQTLRYIIAGIAGLGLLMAIVLGWLLNRLVSGPVSRLAHEVSDIHGHDQKQLQPQTLQRTDEVGRLAGSINAMLTSLNQAHKELEQEKNLVEQEKSLVEQKVVERTRELSETQAELAASVHSLPFGFALVNRDNAILFANDVLSHLFNRPIPTEAEASKKILQDVSADYKSAIDILACIAESQASRKPVERSIAFGPSFFHFIFTPVISKDKHAEVLGTVLIMMDVSEEKALQRSRDEFFSIASHELRTPLTAIRGNSQLILDYFASELKKPDHKDMMTDIHSASIRLIHIVSDFLDVSRLELGKLQFKTEPVDMEKLSREIIREFDVTGSRRKLKLKVEAAPNLPMALADAERVRQIIINLLGNAIKSTDTGGVTLKLSTEKNMLQLAVIDTGRGIPVESQHLLFHKFQQASANILTRDNTQSTGLGLYISLLLTKGMKGALYLKSSEVDKGSTFVLELPMTDNKPSSKN